jgi:hypothetical protein
MLQDLYLLSCYYEPAQAVLYEDEMCRRYGPEKLKSLLADALSKGLIEIHGLPPCAPRRAQGASRYFCCLSSNGRTRMQRL